MATSEMGFIDRLVAEEIRREVGDAASGGRIISAMKCADRILETYRGTGLSRTQIADRVLMAASRSGVAVELGEPGQLQALGEAVVARNGGAHR
jgi:hypothetical protein